MNGSRTRRVEANIWKIIVYKFLGEFYLIAPILVPYYHSNGLLPSQVFSIQAAYTFAVLLFEIPSGYLADVIGRRKTLILGALCFPAGLFIYSTGRSLGAFIVAEVILATANSMRSGCDSAILYDSLAELEREEDYQKTEGRAFFFTRIGTSAASVFGGLVALVSIRLPFHINIATGAMMLPFALLLSEPRREKLVVERPLADILRISRQSFADPRLRFFIGLHALLVSTGLVGLWAAFLYYESLEISIGLFGILFAAFQLASALGAKSSHGVAGRMGSRRSFTLLAGAGLFFVLLGISRTPILLPLIFFNAFLWGFSFPLIMDGMNRFISSESRATVLSVANMAGSFSFVIISIVFGWLVRTYTLDAAYRALGVYFLVYCLATLLFGQKSGTLPPSRRGRTGGHSN